MSIVTMTQSICCVDGGGLLKDFRFWKDRAKTIEWDFTDCTASLWLRKVSDLSSIAPFELSGPPNLIFDDNVLSLVIEGDDESDLTAGDWIGKITIRRDSDVADLLTILIPQEHPLQVLPYV